MTTQAEQVITYADSQLGYHEGRDPNGNWNNIQKYAREMGWANAQAWCATFVCAVFKQVGLLSLIKTPSAGVDQLAVGFKRDGRWHDVPAIGAIIFLGTPEDLNHCGVVKKFDAVNVWSTEGNTNQNGSAQGDGVYTNVRKRRSANVVGYGYPRYTDGIESADPKLSESQPGKVIPPMSKKPGPVESDLWALANKHNVTLVALIRSALFIARQHNSGTRLARLTTAAVALKGMK